MRPAGDCHKALVQAAQSLLAERGGGGATLMELAHRSQVGYTVARQLVANMARHGQLVLVGQRRVTYRNRPVLEYAPGNL